LTRLAESGDFSTLLQLTDKGHTVVANTVLVAVMVMLFGRGVTVVTMEVISVPITVVVVGNVFVEVVVKIAVGLSLP